VNYTDHSVWPPQGWRSGGRDRGVSAGMKSGGRDGRVEARMEYKQG
jgi:hypothetical protein